MFKKPPAQAPTLTTRSLLEPPAPALAEAPAPNPTPSEAELLADVIKTIGSTLVNSPQSGSASGQTLSDGEFSNKALLAIQTAVWSASQSELVLPATQDPALLRELQLSLKPAPILKLIQAQAQAKAQAQAILSRQPSPLAQESQKNQEELQEALQALEETDLSTLENIPKLESASAPSPSDKKLQQEALLARRISHIEKLERVKAAQEKEISQLEKKISQIILFHEENVAELESLQAKVEEARVEAEPQIRLLLKLIRIFTHLKPLPVKRIAAKRSAFNSELIRRFTLSEPIPVEIIAATGSAFNTVLRSAPAPAPESVLELDHCHTRCWRWN